MRIRKQWVRTHLYHPGHFHFSLSIYNLRDLFEKKIFLMFIYLAVLGLRCNMWDLVRLPGIKPGLPALGARSLSHWTTRDVPEIF